MGKNNALARRKVKIDETNIHNATDGYRAFEEALQKYPTLKGICADAGYRKTMQEFVRNILKKTIKISERIAPGWSVTAKRWII